MSTITNKNENILHLILFAIPLAFGIVIIIMSILPFFGVADPVDGQTIFPLIGIGMFTLGLAGLDLLDN